MEEERLDEWPLSVTVKTEPECVLGEYVAVDGPDGVKIKEEPMELIITNALHTKSSETPDSSKDQISTKGSKRKLRRRSSKGEFDGNDEAEIQSLLKKLEEDYQPKRKKIKKIYYCLACDYQSFQRFEVIRHKIKMHREPTHACQLCDFKATYLTDLLKHEKHFHDSEKFYCVKCKFRANNQERLAVHMGSAHRNDMFYCKLCKYKAKQAATLERHMDAHNSGKMYTCEKCSCEFFTQGGLSVHVKRLHNDIIV